MTHMPALTNPIPIDVTALEARVDVLEAGGAAGGSGGGTVIDLTAAGVVINSAAAGASNVAIINSLITTNRTLNKPLVMKLPTGGDLYVDKQGSNSSILIDGCHSGVAIVGDGTTKIIQHGTGTLNDWSGIVINESSNVYLHGFSLMQGEITLPSDGQHDHLIFIKDGAGSGTCKNIRLSNLSLGKALGDCIAFFGNTTTVRNVMMDGIYIDGAGFVQKAWAQSTAYAVGAQVRRDTSAYICTTAGTSASSGSGPTGATAGITDGTVVWSGAPLDITYRYGARSGISYQRGYENIRLVNFTIKGVQNSAIDMESTGSGVMRSASFAHGYIDNSTGNTSLAFSFSGSSTFVDKSKYSSIHDVEIYNGGLQIAETRDCRITNVRIRADQVYPNDPAGSLIYMLRNNEGLEIDGLSLHRESTAFAGNCFNVIGTNGGGRISVRNLYVQQKTAADPVYVENMAGVKLHGVIEYGAASPTTRHAITVSAVNVDATGVDIDAEVRCTTGKLASGVRLNARAGFDMKQISVRVRAATGTLSKIASYSKQSGSTMDANPFMSGSDPGDTTTLLYDSVDESDNPIDGIYPIVSGNKVGQYTLAGTVDPTGKVRAPQGSIYVRLNGNSTVAYLKTLNADKGGWSQFTVGTPTVAALTLPANAASWTTLIADNSLTTAAPTGSWGCQEASGNLAASIGSLSLTAAGAVTYSNAMTGYTDVAVGIPDNGAGVGFSTSDASLPDPSNTSYLMVVIGQLTAVPAAGRSIFFVSAQNQCRINNTAGAARLRVILAGNDAANATDIDTTGVHVWFVKVNETANTVIAGCEAFKSEPAYLAASSASKLFGVGGFDANSAPFKMLRCYMWTGANAEITNTQLKDLIEAFGASVSWTP